MRFLMACFGLALSSGLVLGCSPPPQKETKSRRACTALEQRLSALEHSKIAEQVVQAGEQVLAENPGQQWIDLDGWAVVDLEILHYAHWNDPERFAAEDGAIQTALATIRGYDQALDERDVQLVVVLIPARLDTDPSHLPGVNLPPEVQSANPGLVRFLLELNRSGVDALDLGPAFSKALGAKAEDELYFGYDRHWTPRAVSIAADVVREHIRDVIGLEQGQEKENSDFVVKRERADYLIPPAMPVLLPIAEKPLPLRFDRVLKLDGTPALEQDRESPVLVLGDSFTCYYRDEACDFASQLQAGLARKLDTIAMRAAASRTVWKNVRRRKDDLAGKQVVVWLFETSLITANTIKPVTLFPKK